MKLVKSFTRSFPLVLVQMWGRRYAHSFLGEDISPIPIYIFRYKDGLVTAYRNLDTPNILNPIIKKRLEKDDNFILNFFMEKSGVFGELMRFKDATNFSIDDFKTFLNNLYDYWQVHYISQFVPLDDSFEEKHREEALQIRAKIDKLVHSFWVLIVPSIQKLFPKIQEFAEYVTWDEIKNDDIPIIQELKNRAQQEIILFNDQLITPQELNKLLQQFSCEISDLAVNDNDKITGQVAFPGKVSGRVSKIFKEEDMNKLQEGDILVSYMTMPVFITAIKKAGALVTDEGGITCHAAILARELKKPCIIGTKFATQILKDGDVVEVDADNGVVRIIESNNKVILPDYSNEKIFFQFQAKNLYLLFADILHQSYGERGTLIFYTNDVYQECMSEKHYTTSQQLGLDFYNSKEQFEKFKVDIKKVFNKAKITFPKILDNTLTQKILKNFFKVAKSIFDYYSWMDPLFTDEAFKRSSTSPILKKHLDEVSVIKDEYREQLNSFFLEDDNFLEKLIHKLSRDFDVAVEDLKFYRIHELYGLFEDKKVLSQELRERKNAYLLIGLSKNIESLYGENAQSVIASIVKHREYQGGNIQGTVANVSSTPKIEGRVKKIPLDYSDFVTMKAVMSEMKQGEILVAQSTAPELLPACKKAAAIITNVGGLLSHAAIVSREFNIPCIVGTVHATEVLKDGDLVEVDADNGTVKILETYE